MIYALHGFLGLPSDWDFLKGDFEIAAPNLLSDIANDISMREWAQHNMARLTKPRILLGYSMGGRLAMHLLLAKPQNWDAAVLVSANPGITDVNEIEARKKIDSVWAERFLNDDWQRVVKDWNKQNLFINPGALPETNELERLEKDFRREALAKALENWSIARQCDLAPRLAQVSIPVLWMAGEHDDKYCRLLSGFAQVAKSHRFEKISSAAHRVPWDHPTEFIAKLKNFIAMI